MRSTRSPSQTRSRSRTPALRLLPGLNPTLPRTHAEPLHEPEPVRRQNTPAPALRAIDGSTSILLAGSDTHRRAALLDELTETLPANTRFEEADAVCDVLEHAPGARMAIITGDLEDAPAESMVHMLTQRHPALPVLIVESPAGSDSGHVPARQDLRTQHA